MAQRYVNGTTGSDANNGQSRANAWATIQFAVDQLALGDFLNVWPGTYLEAVTLNVDGAAGFPITFRKDPTAPSGEQVIIDGTGAQRAFQMTSRFYWNFEDFVVMNDGGTPGVDTFVYGIFIGSTIVNPAGIGCSEIHFTRVSVTGVNRNALTDCLGVPVAILSYGDSTGVGTATDLITFDHCSFYDCTTERIDHVLNTGFFNVTGNVKDVAWRDCTFSNVNGADIILGVDMGGNVLGSNPDRPRQMVFLRNDVSDLPSGQGFYNQACHDVLVAENTFQRCKFSVGCNTEAQVSADYDILKRCWVRDNLSIDARIDLNAGAWDATYDDVADVWITNNTVCRTDPVFIADDHPIFLLGDNQAVPGKLGISGDSAFFGNIVASPGRMLLSTLLAGSTMVCDYNLYRGAGAGAFEWLSIAGLDFPYDVTQDRNSRMIVEDTFSDPTLKTVEGFHLRPDSWAKGHGTGAIPSWYYPGRFGAYDPYVQRDVFGIMRQGSFDCGAAIAGASNPIATLAVPSADGAGAWVDVSGLGPDKTIVVGGTLMGAINIDVSNEDTPTKAAPAATVQNKGHAQVSLLAHWMRARVTSYKSGAATALITADGGGAAFVELDVPIPDGAGDAVSVAQSLPMKTVTVQGPYRGTVLIEASLDGVVWAQILGFDQPGVQSKAFVCAYLRARWIGVPAIGAGQATAWVGLVRPNVDPV